MKKILSLTLALLLTMSMTVCAFAAETKTYTVAGGQDATTSGDVILTGKVDDSEVLLSVVMPTTLTFQVATTKAAAGVKTAPKIGATTENAVAAGEGYIFGELITGEGTVTNKSNVAISLSIVDVTDKNGLLDLMYLGVASTDLSEKEAVKSANALSSSKDYEASPLKLANAIAAYTGTANLKVVGAGATSETADSSGEALAVNLPSAEYTVVTTLKVSVAAAE